MNKDWQKVTLDEICVLNQLSTGNKFCFDEIEYIDISSVGTGVLLELQKMLFKDAPSRAKRLVKNGSTILSTVRPNRRSFLYIKNPRPNVVVSTGFAVLDPLPEKILSRFLYYTVTNQSFTDYLTANAKGAAYPAVDTEIIKRAEVHLPTLPTQRRIAAILSAYDELIENNSRRIKILEEMARMIYQEWFVKFRFPGHEQAKFVESSLGMIPAGWEVKKLGDIISLEYGKGLKADQRKPGKYLVYGSSGIVGFHNEYLVENPGIIVGRKGNVGSVFWSDYNFFPIDTVFYVKTKISLKYVYFNLQTQNFINNDAAVPGLNRNQAYLLPFLVPESKLLAYFEPELEPIFTLLKNLRKRNEILKQTRDMLLPKLISGEIDVSDLDILIEER